MAPAVAESQVFPARVRGQWVLILLSCAQGRQSLQKSHRSHTQALGAACAQEGAAAPHIALHKTLPLLGFRSFLVLSVRVSPCIHITTWIEYV